MIKVQGISERGGQVCITAGSSSTTKIVASYPLSTITVYLADGVTLAPIYSNLAGTIAKSNPFTANSDASFAFFIAAGRISIRFSGVGIITPFTISDIEVVGDLGETDALAYASLAAAVTAIGSTVTDLIISTASFPGGASCTVPATLRLVFRGPASLALTTSNTYIIRSDNKDWPTKKIFLNAVAAQGTVSFDGNLVSTEFWGEWWGASVSASATVNAASFNAALAAIGTNNGGGAFASGTLKLGPYRYLVNATLVDGVTAFNSIHIKGTGGLVGSGLGWSGATNGVLLKVTRGRFDHISDCLLFNSVAVGTTVGILETGPAVSMQTHGDEYGRLWIEGFYKGIESGDAAVAPDGSAGESGTLTNVTFQGCTHGFYAGSNFNSLNYLFNNVQFINCDYDIYTVTAFGLTLNRCSSSSNNIFNIYASGNGNMLTVNGWDSETGTKFLRLENNATAIINGISLRAYTLAQSDQNALIEITSSKVSINGIYQGPNGNGVGSTGAHLIYGEGVADINVRNFFTTDTYPIWLSAGNSGPDGSRVAVGHGVLIDNTTGAVISSVQEAWGSVTWPTFSLLSHTGSGLSGTSFTPAQITANTNNYAPLNAGSGAAIPAPMYLRLSTDASRNITGLVFAPVQIDGQTTTIINVGAQNIVLKHQDAASSAANRFLCSTGADITVAADKMALLVYDSTTARWRVLLLP